MTMVLNVPDEVARRLEAAAQERGATPEQIAVEVLDAGLPPEAVTGRRKLALTAIGSSGIGLTGRIDEWLADGFGRD